MSEWLASGDWDLGGVRAALVVTHYSTRHARGHRTDAVVASGRAWDGRPYRSWLTSTAGMSVRKNEACRALSVDRNGVFGRVVSLVCEPRAPLSQGTPASRA